MKDHKDLFHNSISHLYFTDPQEDEANKAKKKNSDNRYTSAQWITFVILALGNLFTGSCENLQGPLFPKEAEAKGATPTHYGLIFGAFELAVFIAAPIMGKLVSHVQPKFLLNSGVLTIGVSYILLGTLDLEPDGFAFIVMAFVIRIIEGVGIAAYRTAVYTIIAAQFKDNIATTFGSLEIFVGIGIISGPTIGGALYDLGGYGLPFFVMGSLELVEAGIIFFVLPNSESIEKEEKVDFWKFWLNPGIMIYSLTIITNYNYIGYNNATLEPHLREFNLSGVLLGVVFAVRGAVFALSSAFWGRLSDRKVGNKTLIFICCCIMAVSLLLIGPLPFFKMEPKLELIIVALFLMGLALAGKLVSAFSGSMEDTIARGFPRDINTFGLISSMIALSQSLGAFVGPSLGGYLLENFGYRMATVVLLAVEILLMVTLTIYASTEKCRESSMEDEERKPIISNNSPIHTTYS